MNHIPSNKPVTPPPLSIISHFDDNDWSLDGTPLNAQDLHPKLSERYQFKLLNKTPNFLQIIEAKIMVLWARISNEVPHPSLQKILDHHSVSKSYKALQKIENTRKLLCDLTPSVHTGLKPFQIMPLSQALAQAYESTIPVSVEDIAEANMAYIDHQNDDMPNLKSVTGRDYVPYASQPQGVFKNFIKPASSVTLSKQDHSGLTSILVNKRAYSGLNITCGVISTEQKATEFVDLINKQRDDGLIDPKKPLIISIHQLNSFLGEKSLIEDEHNMIETIQTKLQESGWKDPVVLHTNHGLQFTTQLPDFMENARSEKLNKGIGTKYREILSNRPKLPANEINKLLDAYESGNHTSTTKIQMELLLDKLLGIHSVLNCKSGLDRTGIMRSINGALDNMFEKKGPSFTIDFVINQEKHLRECNAAEELGLDIPSNEIAQATHRFKSDFFLELQNVAIPLTILSTGVGGITMGYGPLKNLFSNPHIIPFLPRKALDTRGIEHIIVQNNIITPYGRSLIRGESQYRHSL